MTAQLAYPDQTVGPAAISLAETPKYQCFSSLPIFDSLPANKPSASPKMVSAWAEVILCYWRAGIASGAIEPSKPLYLLDMAPQGGHLAWLMLSELRKRIGDQKLGLIPCYINCYSNALSAETALVHPYFKDDIAAGGYDVAHWNESDFTLYLHKQLRVLNNCENPIVILAMGYFQTLASQLVGIVKGKTVQGEAAITIVDRDHLTYEFNYQWQTNPEPLSELAEPLLAHYCRHCNGTTLTLPLQAIHRLNALNRFARGRSLLLASDLGSSNTEQIRLGALCPPVRWCKQDPAPKVNFNAIGVFEQFHGARVWQHQLDDNGMVLHLSWRDDQRPVSIDHFRHMAETLAAAHPDDIRQLAACEHGISDTLTLLRLSDYDPLLLKANLNRLLNQSSPFTQSACRNWQDALVRTWRHYFPIMEYDDFYYRLGLMAIQVGHWGLAKECFQWGVNWYGEDATDLYLFAWCEAVTGGVSCAQKLLARALILQPDHPQALELNSSLTQRVEGWHELNFYTHQGINSSDGTLTLEPLGVEHAASFLYQYRDHQIGIMTRLPQLDTLEQVQNWILEQQKDFLSCFAIMHACWGFVGLVSAHCAANKGYFYFWIGSDFQGQGVGQQSAKLFIEMMGAYGITDFFTSVYNDNLRSQHALERIGFEVMPFKAKAPDDEFIFFHKSHHPVECKAEISREKILKGLSELCEAIGVPLYMQA